MHGRFSEPTVLGATIMHSKNRFFGITMTAGGPGTGTLNVHCSELTPYIAWIGAHA